MHIRTDRLNDSDHLVPHSDSGNGTRYASVLDMKIACADASECDSDQCIFRIDHYRFILFGHFKMTFADICICFHNFT